MFGFRACQRCKGDLFLEENEFGDEEEYCYQCGFRKYGKPVAFKMAVETQDPLASGRAA